VSAEYQRSLDERAAKAVGDWLYSNNWPNCTREIALDALSRAVQAAKEKPPITQNYRELAEDWGVEVDNQ